MRFGRPAPEARERQKGLTFTAFSEKKRTLRDHGRPEEVPRGHVPCPARSTGRGGTHELGELGLENDLRVAQHTVGHARRHTDHDREHRRPHRDPGSGIIILIEKTLRVGDFVDLQSGVRGTVTEIGMRYTRVTTNDLVDVLVPNSEFINDRVTNAASISSSWSG
jgi:hypothetical protein